MIRLTSLPACEWGHAMTEEAGKTLVSDLSRVLTRDGVTVEIFIYRSAADPGWTLEVISNCGRSTVWHDRFIDDNAAYTIFLKTLAYKGMSFFRKSAQVIPFRRAGSNQ